MTQTYVRTFLVASATFLALEAGPVVANLSVRQLAAGRETVQSASAEFPRTWTPGQLFDFSFAHRSRRDSE